MELNRPVDARAYALGVCDAFCEVVRAGVKRIALSHPFTQDELDTVLGADFIRDCTAIAAQYGCGAHHQTEPLLTDLFPISLNAGQRSGYGPPAGRNGSVPDPCSPCGILTFR